MRRVVIVRGARVDGAAVCRHERGHVQLGGERHERGDLAVDLGRMLEPLQVKTRDNRQGLQCQLLCRFPVRSITYDVTLKTY